MYIYIYIYVYIIIIIMYNSEVLICRGYKKRDAGAHAEEPVRPCHQRVFCCWRLWPSAPAVAYIQLPYLVFQNLILQKVLESPCVFVIRQGVSRVFWRLRFWKLMQHVHMDVMVPTDRKRSIIVAQ